MAEKLERVPSGIPGLDELIEGGFITGTISMITGKTGTAKSTFCQQFIHDGCTKYNEGGVYITSEETRANVLREASQHGWDLSALEKKGLLKIIEVPPFEVKSIISRISEAIESMKVRRLIIDSVSMFEVSLEDQYSIRKFLFTLFQRLRELGIVTLVTSEIPEELPRLSQYGAVEFMVDTVIKLQYLELADIRRSLMIRKMRMTKHSPNIHPFEITSNGVEVKRI